MFGQNSGRETERASLETWVIAALHGIPFISHGSIHHPTLQGTRGWGMEDVLFICIAHHGGTAMVQVPQSSMLGSLHTYSPVSGCVWSDVDLLCTIIKMFCS